MFEKLAAKESELVRVFSNHVSKAECVGSWLVTEQEEEEEALGSRRSAADHLEEIFFLCMDYAPYLVVCREQAFAGAYEKFQWQDIVPRRQEMTRNRAGCRDGGGGGGSPDFPRSRHRRHGDATQVPSSSWHHFASVEIGSALDSFMSALSWRRSTPDKQGEVHGRPYTASQGTTNAPSSQAKQRTKKVSFADEIGLALTTVRVFCDSVSSSSCLQRTRSSYSLQAHSRNSTVDTSQLSFLVKFAQPWTCSDSFRSKVQSSNVILSNFLIQNGVVHGEIEVRNIAYEKTVFLRYTSSDWSSSTDVCASYVARPEQKFPGYDTFSFQFPVPLDLEKPGRMEFAVCYVASGQTFWDNNGGRNYEIVKVKKESRAPYEDDLSILQEFQGWRLDSRSEKGGSGVGKVVQQGRKQQNTTDCIVFSVLHKKPVEWTEFIGWKWDTDYNRPYW